MSSLIEQRWAELLTQSGSAHQRVDRHPLQLFYGSDKLGRPIFFLITVGKPHLPRLSAAVNVERRQREVDGKWTLLLGLTDNSLRRPFINFCTEVIHGSSTASSEGEALSALYRTLDQWRSLLRMNDPRAATREQLRGLFAELWFARDGLAIPLQDAVDAWVGPYGAAQDFRFTDGRAFEVKAVHSGARHVEISSVEQLDSPDSQSLTLCLVNVGESEQESDGFASVPFLIGRLREELRATASGVDAFDHRLASLNFDPFGASSSDVAFRSLGARRFRVTDGFPRLLRRDVPQGVEDIRFRIRLSSIEAFEV